eukprot:gnl/TRDRNA2_/TRDRNA2_177478_c1_seq6.p2 gnl/TRDRNA2_/TRDRNA2_177478_c1~~gnl/TRDRNA2_/TRDRNA2_177478_c1_seq6.p2  ORF type:complete len:123 (+),score=19.07 gnl/TRDRNA2_/TRDRNA2_177478_c1_seq6:347-715(+)
MKVAIVFQGYLFVAYGMHFGEAALIAQITGFFGWLVAAAITFVIVDAVFSPNDKEAILLSERRKYTLLKIKEACGRHSSPEQEVGSTNSPGPTVSESHPLQLGDWGRIHRLDGTSIDRTKGE